MKKKAQIESPSLYNLVLTNGKSLIATRYSTQPEIETRSLHISSSVESYTRENEELNSGSVKEDERSVLISSEVLTENRKIWKQVPENHFIMVEEDLTVRIEPLQ